VPPWSPGCLTPPTCAAAPSRTSWAPCAGSTSG
jgi:hypothetical protein